MDRLLHARARVLDNTAPQEERLRRLSKSRCTGMIEISIECCVCLASACKAYQERSRDAGDSTTTTSMLDGVNHSYQSPVGWSLREMCAGVSDGLQLQAKHGWEDSVIRGRWGRIPLNTTRYMPPNRRSSDDRMRCHVPAAYMKGRNAHLDAKRSFST